MVKQMKKITALVMALLVGFGMIFPINAALAGTPSSLNTNVSISGIEDGGTIDGSEEVEITVDFQVPVIGDSVDDYYNHGDSVALLLSSSFYFDPEPENSIDLMYETKKLGTVTLSNNSENQAIATIVFDGDEDIFDPNKLPEGELPYSKVSGQFKASFKYNGTHDTDEDGNKTVSILEKIYKLQLPGDTINYKVEKGAAADLDEGIITWTVDITAERDTEPDPTPIDLSGYIFEDDLDGVGEYVEASFNLIGGTLSTPDENSTKLRYTFPVGSISPQTLEFKTKIPSAKMTAGGDITNSASLYLDDEKVDFGDCTVSIASPSVTKNGETTDSVSDPYESKDRLITWYIQVNNEGRTLKDLIITDELQSDLIFESAKWQKLNGSDWTDVAGIEWTDIPADNKYIIGDIDYTGRLVIVTQVPDDEVGVTKKTYYNQATASWKGSGGTSGSATSGKPGVGIGYNALTKSGSQSPEDVQNHQITWTIDVNMRGQDPSGFKVYDLFVHDSNTSDTDLTGAANWPDELSIGSKNIRRNNGQKFVDVISKDVHLNVNPIELKKDDETIATLVEITNLQNSDNKVDLKSQVLDPDIIAGNDQNGKVYNYASLYQNNIYKGSANTYVDYNNKILAKELLRRAEVDNDHNPEASIDPDNSTINAADGFHYGYKEVIFRLNINAAGVDFPNVETNLPGDFGDVVVTDALPEGWEFAKFSGGQDYLIYETTGDLQTGSAYPSTGSLETGELLNSVTGLTAEFNRTDNPQTAKFTFKELNQPYVILVKARPTDATFDGYLKGDNTRDETNTLRLNSENWTDGKSVSQKVTVDSTILNKTLDLKKVNDGILTWTVNYTPFQREIGTRLEDTLPEGIDLRTDSSGKLIWEDQEGNRNINVHVLTMKNDGSGEYAVDTELTVDELKTAVNYDNDSRKLTFTFPEKTRAYRLTYVTDITGMPGNVSNVVKLVDVDGTGTSTEQSFRIYEQYGKATLGRSGYLVVKKTDINTNPLSGAEFTLYNTNGDGSKASARAVRTTGDEGTVKFYGLAPGNYILVETNYPAGYENPAYEYNVVVDSDLKTTVNGSAVITNSNPFVIANYTAEDPVGSLTISKTVAGNSADTAKAFQFTLTLSDTANAYSYIGYGIPGGTISSGDTFSLAHGQSITITGLPEGTTYTVTEADYSDEGYTTVSTGATGSIVKNTRQIASFTNTKNVSSSGPDKKTGTLTISKTVIGTGGDNSKEFNFTVTFTRASGSYPYTGNGVPDGRIKSGDTISLAHGESITITGLPENAKYTVTEDDYTEEGYITASIGATGVISASTSQTAAFTNEWISDPGEKDPGENDPGESETPEDPSIIIDDDDNPQGPLEGEESGLPKTGESQTIGLAKIGLLFFSAALALLLAFEFILRKRYFGKNSCK